VGVNVWMLDGGAAFLIARFIPAGETPKAEAVAAFVVANLAGFGATALDFGGWKEPDWRAGVFVFLCVAAALAMVRLVRLSASRAAS
jgi:hypothetical protein